MSETMQRNTTGSENQTQPPARPRLGLRYGQTTPLPQSGGTR
ncbi:MAG: hypothetical protein ABIS14_12365 [Sphingomonas sp.]